MRPVIAFDVDGTLIDNQDRPRHDIIDLLRAFQRLGCEVWVWSGGGLDYAQRWVERLGLEPDGVYAKDPRLPVDLAIDDAEGADLGRMATLVVPVWPTDKEESA
jgi:phosphoserine phosphatase